MTDKVVSLEARRAQAKPAEAEPHMSGPARCIQCRHEWVAVAPIGTVWLECPGCGSSKGTFLGACMPAVGEQVWRCNCGSEMFYIVPADGPTCHGCGVPATGWF